MNYLLYLSLIPSVILGFYIYKNDKVEKEPISLLLRCFVGGILSGFAIMLLSLIFRYKMTSSLTNILFYSFIVVSLLEEGIKFIMTYLLCFKNREFNYMYDGICYASFLSLGFATLENILYVLTTNSILVALARSVATVPAHVFFAIFMGYFLGIAKYYLSKGDKKNKNISLLKALLVPIILHGFFDFCLYSNNIIFTLTFLLFLALLYIESFKKVKQMGNIRNSLYEK